jgi:plastocyanin
MRAWILATALVIVLVAPVIGGAGTVDLHAIARAGSRPVMDVVAWLDAPGSSPLSPETPPVLDQRNLEFFPHVLAVRVGTKVRFPNHDRVFHNVFSWVDGKKFDLGVYPVNAVKYVTFDRVGVSRLFCNIHPGMAAYVVAVDSPYFATSDTSGRLILQAPVGRYTYHAWRAGASPLTGSVEVDGLTTLDLSWP